MKFCRLPKTNVKTDQQSKEKSNDPINQQSNDPLYQEPLVIQHNDDVAGDSKVSNSYRGHSTDTSI